MKDISSPLKIEYVDHHLYSKSGERVAGKLKLPNALQISRLAPAVLQHAAIIQACGRVNPRR